MTSSLADRFLVKWKGIPMVFGLVTSATFHWFNNRQVRFNLSKNNNVPGLRDQKIAEQTLRERRRKELMLHVQLASYGVPVVFGTIATGGILSSLPGNLRFFNSTGFALVGLGLSIGAFILGALLMDGPVYAYNELVHGQMDGGVKRGRHEC